MCVCACACTSSQAAFRNVTCPSPPPFFYDKAVHLLLGNLTFPLHCMGARRPFTSWHANLAESLFSVLEALLFLMPLMLPAEATATACIYIMLLEAVLIAMYEAVRACVLLVTIVFPRRLAAA